MGCDDIIRDYLDGLDVPTLARKHHHTNRTVSRILREAGVLGILRRRGDAARRGQPSPAHLRSQGLQGCPTDPQWAYIAGLLDGEGSIVSLGHVAHGHRRFIVSAVQKDPTPLVWLRAQVGAGAIHFANGTYRYQLRGQQAVFEFLMAVERYLVVQRSRADMALASLAVSYGWERMRSDSRGGQGREPSEEREQGAVR
jgi:hypothetical protein